METVCPRCLVFQSSRFCGECGSESRPGNYCSKCPNISPPGTRFCGECGGPSLKTAVENRGGNRPNPNAPRQPQNVKVDTSSIFDSVSPSAVFKGVSGGLDENLSKYRINNTEDVNQDIDWKKTLRAASRANVEDDDDNEVMAVKGPEPVVTPNPHTTQTYVRPTGTLPSEQMRREDHWGSRGNTANPAPPPGAYRPPQSNVQIRAPTQQNPVPPGRGAYNPPVYNTRSVGTTVEESTIRPSLLRDTSDPLEKYRIKDSGNPDPAAQPKTVFHKDT